jgi:hypothetical protein
VTAVVVVADLLRQRGVVAVSAVVRQARGGRHRRSGGVAVLVERVQALQAGAECRRVYLHVQTEQQKAPEAPVAGAALPSVRSQAALGAPRASLQVPVQGVLALAAPRALAQAVAALGVAASRPFELGPAAPVVSVADQGGYSGCPWAPKAASVQVEPAGRHGSVGPLLDVQPGAVFRV